MLELGCMFKENCPHLGPKNVGGVFLRYPIMYLQDCRRKSRKKPKGLGQQTRPTFEGGNF